MGFWRLSKPGVLSRVVIGALGSVVLLFSSPVSAAASPINLCGTPGFPPCYTPAQLRTAYDVPASITGAGETIVIISGYYYPFVGADLAAFSNAFGLPAPTAGNFHVYTPDGTVAFLPTPTKTQLGWAKEQATDVEWAHAIAPDAHLVLVEGLTGGDADILSAIKFAIDNNLGDVISMSFSEAESCSTADLPDQHAAFERAVAQGITLVAASGDHGPMQPTCDGSPVLAVGTPASDPLVTAVGGANLTADPSSGAYQSETAWSHSGGGFSSVYARPAYQAPFQKNNKARGVPDVAWHADDSYATVIGFHGMFGPQAGTSVATAEWAGVVAIADQAAGHRLGLINEALYHAAKSNGEADRFHDLTSDKHAWDTATGLGTPDVANLVAWIAKTS